MTGIFFKAESLAQVKKKLITNEDPPPYFHKVVGISSILSFIYWYLIHYNFYGKEFTFDNPTFWEYFSIFIHMMPAMTSLIFHVPKTRIAKKPMIIYEEYRQHAILFSGRALVVFLVGAFYPKINNFRWMLQIGSVLMMHLLVDEVTRRHGKSGMTTVRAESSIKEGQTKKNNITIGIQRSYSLYQFLALGTHLVPIENYTATLGWNSNIAIQSSAFFMTLYRKGIIRGRAHFLVYSLCLMASAFHIVRLTSDGMALFISFFFFLRTFGFRKYLLWSTFCASMYVLENHTDFDILKFSPFTEYYLPESFFAYNVLLLCAICVFTVRTLREKMVNKNCRPNHLKIK